MTKRAFARRRIGFLPDESNNTPYTMIATTLPATPPTLQEIFDTVVAHLREQKVKCSDGHGCLYRSDYPGQACAVGCLIPDSLYHRGLEALGIYNLFAAEEIPEFFAAYGIASNEDPAFKLLSDFQDLHDNTDPVAWESAFRNLAFFRTLTYNEPR